MKLNNFVAVCFAVMVLTSFSAQAAIINVAPNVPTIDQGNAVTVDITVSGLGDGTAPSLGVFDLDLFFDNSILGFNSVTFGSQLDLFGFGSLQLDDSSIAGTVNLFELSFDLPGDLDTLQAPDFVLASLVFDTLAAGTTDLLVAVNSLGDSLGDPLSSSINNSSLEVTSVTVPTPVPSPASSWLILLGVFSLFVTRKRYYASKPFAR